MQAVQTVLTVVGLVLLVAAGPALMYFRFVRKTPGNPREEFDSLRSADTPVVVLDLDAIVTEELRVRVNGRIVTIRPIDVEEYINVTEAMGRLEELQSRPRADVDINEMVDAYYKVFSAVTKDLTKQQVYDMKLPQMGALLQGIIDHLGGKNTPEELKKKIRDMKAVALKESSSRASEPAS